MAKSYQYCVAENWGKGFIDHDESWNGSAWTELTDMARSTGLGFHGCSGSSTAGLIFGGYPPGGIALTEDWNGVSWVEVGDLNTGRAYHMGAGTSTAALSIAGTPGGSANTTAVEEWSGSSITTKVLTD